MKINRIIALLLAAISVLSLAACNVAGSLYSEKNAYVSVYVYGENGKSLISEEAVRVAPIDEPTEEETIESGLLSEEAARDRYRVIPTPMYAVETCIKNDKKNKDKGYVLPELEISQLNDGTIKYIIDSIKGCSVENTTGSNDIFEWVCTVNDVVVDPFTTKLETYDKVVFTRAEITFRTFTVTFEINNGEETLIPEVEFNVEGEKSELTISKYLSSDYLDDKTGEPVKPVKDELGITLSEDGKRVVKIGDIENDEENHWICYMGDEEEIINDLTDTMISERITISFDYVEINSEETEEGEEEEEPEE